MEKTMAIAQEMALPVQMKVGRVHIGYDDSGNYYGYKVALPADAFNSREKAKGILEFFGNSMLLSELYGPIILIYNPNRSGKSEVQLELKSYICSGMTEDRRKAVLDTLIRVSKSVEDKFFPTCTIRK